MDLPVIEPAGICLVAGVDLAAATTKPPNGSDGRNVLCDATRPAFQRTSATAHREGVITAVRARTQHRRVDVAAPDTQTSRREQGVLQHRVRVTGRPCRSQVA